MSLKDALLLSSYYEKQASLAKSEDKKAFLEKKALSDLCAFGMFKESAFGSQLRRAWPAIRNGVGFGAGLAVPTIAAGSYLVHRAGNQAKDVSHSMMTDARNQALMAAAGIGGLGAIRQGIVNAASPSYGYGKYGSDEEFITKLSEFLILDDYLVDTYSKSGSQKDLIHLFINRSKGTDLLRSY